MQIFRRDSTSERLVSLEWAVLIFIALAFSPQTSSRHMILTLLIYTVAGAIFFAQDKVMSKFVLAIVSIILSAALIFPLGGAAVHALEKWRAIGGANWCAWSLILVLVSIGTRTIREKEISR